MIKRKVSGKTRLVLGSLSYLKEELKTLNFAKIRALRKIISGYIEIRFRTPKKANQRKLSPGLDEL